MGSSRARWRARVAACIAMTCVCIAADAREKTDVIEMRNGDRVTGEIIKLEYGLLELETDDMGTLQIEWAAIKGIRSEYSFDVERIGGGRVYGLLSSTPDGEGIVVGADSEATQIEKLQIARIAQLEPTFWSRIDGSFSVGINYAKSTDVFLQSAQFNATYRGEKIAATLSASANSSKTPEEGTLDRDSLAFTYRWLRPDKNFWAGLATLERNEELGIDARLQVGGGFGRYLHQTPSSELSAFAGAAATREKVVGQAEDEESAEGIIGVSWRIFKLQTPKTSLSSQLVLYPSITESGRYRGHSDATLRHEIVTDFFLDLSFYYDYDNEPPGETTATDDYGVTTSLGYSF